jgi:hypothetical protein
VGNGGGGKGLTAADAVEYFTFLKNTADLYGLKIGLKNAVSWWLAGERSVNVSGQVGLRTLVIW